jgi:valyl-tRNA synthetase
MELSKHFEFKTAEAAAYKRWESSGDFTADASSDRPPYSIVIPPPNITGILHMGHALNNTLQDVLIRFRHMQGYNTMWLPGTDHAAIATEVVVIRQLEAQGIQRPRETLGREKFIEKVWEWREKSGRTIVGQLKRLGCALDWSRERFTMDEGLSRAVRRVFSSLYHQGLIYRGTYLVNWSPGAQTTLADDEVEYQDKIGKLYYIRYPVSGRPGQYLTVATTRPETMLGDTAVAVHPEDERYREFIGKTLDLPLTNRTIPVIADPMVERDFGTGALKITPAHDPNDWLAGKRHNLPEISVLDRQARINENGGPAYQGLDRYEARQKIVADLQKAGLLEKVVDHPQRVGTCYRTGVEIEPMLSMQWFVKVAPLAKRAREVVANGEIRFHPEARKADYFRWLDNLRDWAISRQIWWGHQIPAFYGPNDEVLVPKDDAEYEELVRKAADPSSGIKQDSDTLDTWFSSALWPFSTLGWPDETEDLKTFYPTATLVTAKDIIFFWVARMIMMSLHFMDRIPFRDVYFNPIVADEHGKKMSKSRGNAIDPIELIDAYGTDALRITLAAYAGREQHIAFKVQECEGYRNFMNKLWNAARLVIANTEDISAEAISQVGTKAWPITRLEDRWILSRLAKTVQSMTTHLDEFEFDECVRRYREFFWNDFCDYYLELTKPRIYGSDGAPPDAEDRATAQAILVIVLENALRLLHPVCPFITDEIWRVLQGRYAGSSVAEEDSATASPGDATLASLHAASLFSAPWPTLGQEVMDEGAESEFARVQQAIYVIRNIRGEMGMPPGSRPDVTIHATDSVAEELLARESELIRSLARLGSLSVTAEAPDLPLASTGLVTGGKVFVAMPAEMIAAERARLTKETERLEKLVRSQESKLESPAFLEKAPAAVIQKEQDKLAQLQTELDQLRERLVRLG